MTILGSGFGWIETDSGRFDHDIIVFPDGRTENRYHHLKGSSHVLSPDETRTVLDGTKAGLVLGTGQYGLVQVPPATRKLLEELNAQLHAAPTPEAITEYNSLSGPKCAVFHVTC